MKSGFELRSVTKKYDEVMALTNISFSIETGENLAIIGSSGCGKSTVLRLLAGLETPTSGEILLDGVLISKAGQIISPPHQRRVAMVFQDLALWSNLSVLDNVLFGLATHPLSEQEKHRKATEALTLCNIETLSGRKPEKLSGGQQQRVALARALAAEPDFLFLDEPFSGLDLVTKIMLLEEVSLLAQMKKITLVLVSHDPLEATTLCRQAVILNQGMIEESGAMKDLLREPKSQILQVFKENMKIKGEQQ